MKKVLARVFECSMVSEKIHHELIVACLFYICSPVIFQLGGLSVRTL